MKAKKNVVRVVSFFLLLSTVSCNDGFDRSIDSRLNNRALIFKYHQDGLVNPLFEFDSIEILDFKDRNVFRYKGYQNDTIELIQIYSIAYERPNDLDYLVIELEPTLILNDYNLEFRCSFDRTSPIVAYVQFGGNQSTNCNGDCFGDFYYLDETDLSKYFIKEE